MLGMLQVLPTAVLPAKTRREPARAVSTWPISEILPVTRSARSTDQHPELLLESVLAGSAWQMWATVYGLLGLRYVLIAGTAALVFYGWGKNRLRHRKIEQRWPRGQGYRQLAVSLVRPDPGRGHRRTDRCAGMVRAGWRTAVRTTR